MSKTTRGYVHRVDIRAELADVWQALIDPAIIMRWHVPSVRVDAREGGSYWTRTAKQLTREAHIDIFLPPRRLRLIYMPLRELPADEVVIVDDFLLDHDQAATQAKGAPVTVLRLMGSGIPDARNWDAMYLRLRGDWERSLLRLKASFERTPGLPPAAKKTVPKPKAPPSDEFLPWPEPTPPKRR
jgi:hypothetical protein